MCNALVARSDLPPKARLRASVTPAIFLTEIPERYILEDRLLYVPGHALVTLEDLRYELALAVWSPMLGRKWEQVSRVMAIVACPSV